MRFTSIALIFMSLFAFLPAKSRADSKPLTIVHMTDPHYISPSLTDRGAAFISLVSNADGKLVLYSEELLSAFLYEMRALRPDAILVSGDLTFNGATQSHRDLALRLRTLTDAGIPVLVLPGNHDMYSKNAARFSGVKIERVESPDTAGFREIWHAFGPDDALSCAPDSFSCMYALSPGLRILMLDAHTETSPNTITEQTLLWAKEQLRLAREAGAQVISVSHETLLRHNPLFEEGFRLENGENVSALLREAGVSLHLSGHMHIQHIASDKKLTEIVTSAFSVQPCQYGVITFDGESLRYETKRADVAAWAKAQGRNEEILLRFPSQAASFFASSMLRQILPNLRTLPDANDVLVWMLNVNLGYYSGQLSSLSPNPHVMEILKKNYPFWYVYFDSIRDDYGKDYTRWPANPAAAAAKAESTER